MYYMSLLNMSLSVLGNHVRFNTITHLVAELIHFVYLSKIFHCYHMHMFVIFLTFRDTIELFMSEDLKYISFILYWLTHICLLSSIYPQQFNLSVSLACALFLPSTSTCTRLVAWIICLLTHSCVAYLLVLNANLSGSAPVMWIISFE